MSRLRVRAWAAQWTWFAPILAVAVLSLVWGRTVSPVAAVGVAVLLAVSVLAAVHHAEVVSQRVGEPFGSLVLAVAVTVIEVALIVSLMISGGAKTVSLARDTVFAAVMITCNGIVGIALVIGTLRHRVVAFNAEGMGAALATIAALATLSLALPAFTISRPGPTASPGQLGFAAVASLALYALFVLTQTVRHRDYFLPPEQAGGAIGAGEHVVRPSPRRTLSSLALLLVALVAVVGLAKAVSPAIESALAAAGLPQKVVGVVIALLVLLPETIAAVRAARRDRIQISLNLAFGSAMASIGLTIPAIAMAGIWLRGPLVLGLGPTHLILLALTVVIATLTVVPGRATLLQGGVHLFVFAAFLTLAVSP
ncbi:ionic transporter y4hA [Actinoallomurus oryzae]|uniref:Ionic transporter y4hA n=1 Tax=Actinoallomurus oryzae TaxID=502180 RepID=A0ABP8Q3E3_9ACTN